MSQAAAETKLIPEENLLDVFADAWVAENLTSGPLAVIKLWQTFTVPQYRLSIVNPRALWIESEPKENLLTISSTSPELSLILNMQLLKAGMNFSTTVEELQQAGVSLQGSADGNDNVFPYPNFDPDGTLVPHRSLLVIVNGRQLRKIESAMSGQTAGQM